MFASDVERRVRAPVCLEGGRKDYVSRAHKRDIVRMQTRKTAQKGEVEEAATGELEGMLKDRSRKQQAQPICDNKRIK